MLKNAFNVVKQIKHFIKKLNKSLLVAVNLEYVIMLAKTNWAEEKRKIIEE